jgi:hypothetical protein
MKYKLQKPVNHPQESIRLSVTCLIDLFSWFEFYVFHVLRRKKQRDRRNLNNEESDGITKYSADQTNEVEVNGASFLYGEQGKCGFVRIPDGKRPLGTPMPRMEGNVK